MTTDVTALIELFKKRQAERDATLAENALLRGLLADVRPWLPRESLLLQRIDAALGGESV